MKKLAVKLSVIFIPFGILVLCTNLMVDPANIFSGEEYVKKIVAILSSGNNVDNISNYNERLLQKYFLQSQVQKEPDIVIMGSSRVMEISHNIYPGKKLLNIGVSHGNIYDLMALAGVMSELRIKPEEILIGVDPFLIGKGEKGAGEWVVLNEYVKNFLTNNCPNCEVSEIKDEKESKVKKYYTAITFDYFRKSIEFLYKGNTKSVENVGTKVPKKYGRYVDGSIAYSKLYQNPDTMLVANVAKSTAKIPVPEADSNKLKYLACLLNYCKVNGTNVTFLMLPFHPNYYTTVNNNQENIFNEYEMLYHKLAKQYNLKVVGSFSAQKEKLWHADFYDTYHCSGSAIKKIFENYNIN
jgi:hypothetical protein